MGRKNTTEKPGKQLDLGKLKVVIDEHRLGQFLGALPSTPSE